MRLFAVAALPVSLALTGCTLTSTAPAVPTAGPSLQGRVHGGQQPVVGASVYLYAANATAYGGPFTTASSSNASISLLNSNVLTNNPLHSGIDSSSHYYVTTDANGNFSIGSDYTCTAGQQVYLYAVGGNPGAGTNSAAGFLAILGTCPSAGNFATATPFLFVNEVTTIAAAYAFAGFATDATHVSTNGTALATTGIVNAFDNAANLAALATGTALAATPSGAGVPNQPKTNTLANILAACINSTGPTSASCTTLFNNDQSLGPNTGLVATDTATAAIYLAHNSFSNITSIGNLFALQSGTAPFAPALSTQPNHWFLAIVYSGGGLSTPSGMAIDAAGNGWIANPANNSLTEISASGYVLSPSAGLTGGGLNEPTQLAIDANGYIWVSNLNGNSLSAFTSSGSAVTTSSAITSGGLNQPKSVAVDGLGNIWVANAGGNSISEFYGSNAVNPNTPGKAISTSTGFTGGGLNQPNRLAIDGAGNAWITNYGNNTLSEFNTSGSPLATTALSGGGLNEPTGIALDFAGNAWISNGGGNTLSEFNNLRTAISTSAGISGGGLDGPIGLAFDGTGDVWTLNEANDTYSEFAHSTTPISTSFIGPTTLVNPVSGAIDGSGNGWTVNQGNNTVSVSIGAATPVITPLCAGLPSTLSSSGASNLASRP